VRRRDVEQNNLVGSRRGVAMRKLCRVTGVDNVDKLNAFDDTPIAYV
jgi:hypothetical protein